MDIKLWPTDGSEPVFDENGFFNIPRMMEGNKTGQGVIFPTGKAVIIPREENLIGDRVCVSKPSINLPVTALLESSSGFPSVLTNGLSLERHIDCERFEENLGLSVGLSVPYTNGFSKTGSDYVGTVQGGMIRDENNSHSFLEDNLCVPTADQTCSMGREGVTFMDQANDKKQENTYLTGSCSRAPVDVKNAWSKNKRRSKGIPWGNYEEVMASLLSPVSSYSLLYEKPQFQKPPKPKRKEMHGSNANPIKKKPASKEPLDDFPANVRSLMSTGIFNEALVRYVTPSRELPGILSAAGYFCGCESCNFSKAISADEFERHAGCKTSHANTHIRFENGMSMHEVVTKLRKTPRDELFDALQTITGCSINQDALNAWKELYQDDFRSKYGQEMGNGKTIRM